MKNLFSDEVANKLNSDLALRVYSSNLLGQSDELVLHGGGNTSVKCKVDGEEILYVKGSGWDLVSIKEEGFAPVKLNGLKQMAMLNSLSDSDMVSQQKALMIDKSAPNPSVEAILHAIIPFKFVDHTHADAIVTISNSKRGKEIIKELFPNFLIAPYVMPGFILAKEIYNLSRDVNWEKCEGIILHNHGIFTFDNSAKIAYSKMIDAVTKAENYLNTLELNIPSYKSKEFDLKPLKEKLEQAKGYEVFLNINNSDMAIYYSKLPTNDLSRGVLTPEHIIRTKRVPLVLKNGDNFEQKVDEYIANYIEYFNRYATNETMLNPAPNYAVIEDFGVVSFGKSQKEANIINDIITHTIKAVLLADKLGGYVSINEKDSFDMEYWELEQAKLKGK